MEIKNNIDDITNSEDVYIGDLNIQYVQNMDSCGSGDEAQELKVERLNAGGGDYWNISTTRWSFDKLDDLITVLKHFKEISKLK